MIPSRNVHRAVHSRMKKPFRSDSHSLGDANGAVRKYVERHADVFKVEISIAHLLVRERRVHLLAFQALHISSVGPGVNNRRILQAEIAIWRLGSAKITKPFNFSSCPCREEGRQGEEDRSVILHSVGLVSVFDTVTTCSAFAPLFCENYNHSSVADVDSDFLDIDARALVTWTMVASLS